MLNIKAENRFGNRTYVFQDGSEGTHISELDTNDFWTIELPSSDVVVRTYGDRTYLMSRKAADNILKYKGRGGSVTVLSCIINDEEFIILTGDNKRYLMNCGGSCDNNTDETYKQTAVREIKEELNISIDVDRLDKIATYSFEYSNVLIGDVSWENVTKCFRARLKQDEVQHLIPSGHVMTDMNVFEVSELGETELVVFLKPSVMSEIPKKIHGKDFDGHHRKIICHVYDIDNDINVDYLSSLKWNS